MSQKYFTGSNNVVGGGKNQLGDTGLTKLGKPETVPVDTVDGIDAKGQGKGSKWDRIYAKMYSTTALEMKGGKARTTKLIGKYNLGRMWKYRKTLKKLFTATGAAAATGTPKGERNMFSLKGQSNARAKHSKGAATDNTLYPISQTK